MGIQHDDDTVAIEWAQAPPWADYWLIDSDGAAWWVAEPGPAIDITTLADVETGKRREIPAWEMRKAPAPLFGATTWPAAVWRR